MVKLSIITPVYNVEKCIARSVNSIINQTMSDFEYILIDDGSKDNSIKIAKELLGKSDINYKIIVQENGGVSTARNRGIKEASGEYITFLDSDDYFHEKFLEETYINAKKYDADVIFTDYSEVDGDGKVLLQSRTSYLNEPIDGEKAALMQLGNEIIIGMRSAIYRRSIIKDNNLFFDTNRKYGEDMIFIVKALIASKKVMSVGKILAYYVIWENSVTQNVSLKHLDCYNSYVDLLDELKREEKCQEIRRFLLQYKIPYSICHVFSIFSRDKGFFGDLYKFMDKNEIKVALSKFKIQKYDKINLRYLVQCKCIRYMPKVTANIFNKIHGNKQ